MAHAQHSSFRPMAEVRFRSASQLSEYKGKGASASREILTIHFSEIRQQIRVTRELLNQTALKTVLLKKQINITHGVLEFCTGRFATSALAE